MHYRFHSTKLKRLYTQEKGAHKYPPDVVSSFFEVMDVISAAQDERDLRAFKSLHFEALRGDRKGQWSMRLGKQFRLIFTIEESAVGKTLVILEIVDYH